MADYIYLLESRLTAAQRTAIHLVREVARARGLTIFLVGGAVRDLTSGSPVRDLDVVVQGNASKLKKELEKAGATIVGEQDAAQAIFLRFPGSVRMEFGSTMSVTYPKPGKPVMKPASIQEDLRRRDFTANAMALSLNDGSYGLLMDPLNGVADIENRELRLVSNYGFIEDPVRMIRAARLMARSGWTLEGKTEARYQTGKTEGYISVLSEFHRGYELEEIAHEEDSLRVLKRLELEGWMKILAPYWSSAKVNVAELERMRDVQTQLQLQGIQPDPAAANFPLLTSKLASKEIATLKASFPRQGFVKEIESLEAQAKEFAAQLSGKGAALPSQAWKLLTSAAPEVVLWTAFSNKSAPLQAKFKSFSQEWPQARLKMPYVMMQEMRIVPELAGYDELLEKLFFELMDGKLGTPEEMKAFLEPYSPPAPPPPVNLRRQRAAKKESKPAKSRSRKAAKADEDAEEDESAVAIVADAEPDVSPEAKPAPAAAPAVKKEAKPAASKAVEAVAAKTVAAKAAPVKAAPPKPVPPAAKKAVPAPAKAVPTKPSPKTPVKQAPAKKAVAKKAAVKVVPGKKVAAKAVPVKNAVPSKTASKSAPPAKAAKKAAPAKKAVPAKKTAAKAAVKGARVR